MSKNSGGTATYPKIAAARALGIPVVMIARPFKAAGVPVADARGALPGKRSNSSECSLAAGRVDPRRVVVACDQPRRAGTDDDEGAHISHRGINLR